VWLLCCPAWLGERDGPVGEVACLLADPSRPPSLRVAFAVHVLRSSYSAWNFTTDQTVCLATMVDRPIGAAGAALSAVATHTHLMR
jgi:hypothetical protein